MKKYPVVSGNVYIFPAQRLRVIRGLCQGDEGYLVGWMHHNPHDKKDKRIRCVLMLDEWGKVDLPMEIVRPVIHKDGVALEGDVA